MANDGRHSASLRRRLIDSMYRLSEGWFVPVVQCRSLLRFFSIAGFSAAVLVVGTLSSNGGLIHEWEFNETSGTNLQDSVGGANGQVVVLAGGGGFQLTGSAVRLDGGARASADYV